MSWGSWVGECCFKILNLPCRSFFLRWFLDSTTLFSFQLSHHLMQLFCSSSQLWSELLCPHPRFIHWHLIPQDEWEVIRSGDPRDNTCTFHHVKAKQKVSSLQSGRGPSPELDHAGTLIWDFHPPELWKCISIVYKLFCYCNQNRLRHSPWTLAMWTRNNPKTNSLDLWWPSSAMADFPGLDHILTIWLLREWAAL